MPSPVLVHAALLFVSVMFGINYVATKVIVGSGPDQEGCVAAQAWVFFRIAAATVLLAAFVIWRRPKWPRGRLYGWLFLAAMLGMVLNQLLFTEGMTHTTPEHSAVINASIPVLTLLFAGAVRQEALTLRKFVAIGVALTGVLTLLRADQMLDHGPLGPYLWGDLLTLGNATSFSMFVVLMRHLGRRVDPVAATMVCFVMASLVIGAYAAPALTGDAWDAVLSAHILPWALFAILGSTVLTYVLNNWALGHVDSSLVVLYIYVQPIVATTMQILRGAEVPGPRFFVATALVSGGILLAALARRGERGR